MDTTTLNSMCRCCAAEGMFKDIKTSYHWMGEEEVYGDMLRECFDVKLVSVEDGGICEVCITQLRNASNFKKQVLHTEKKFKRILDSRQFKPTEVKEEVSGDENSSSEDNENDRDVDNDNIDDEDYVPDFEMPIKTESPEESKSRKRGAKATTSRAKKSRVADDEDKSINTKDQTTIKSEVIKPYEVALVKIQKLISEDKLKMVNVQRKTNKNNQSTFSKNQNYALINQRIIPAVDSTREIPEIDKHRSNIRSVIRYSNATPIRAHFGNGYACCFCEGRFLKAADLKAHTIKDHDDKTKNKFMNNSFLHKFMVKLDITSLTCNICSVAIDTLEQLLAHLNDAHDKNLYTDIASRVVCFKLDGEVTKCHICSVTFNSFKQLLEHMNKHFSNFICDECGASFICRDQLLKHSDKHTEVTHKCGACSKEFRTYAKMRAHKRETHKSAPGICKCHQCGERFKNWYSRRDHLNKAHGIEFPEIKCDACGRICRNSAALRIHKNRDHLMERRYQCDLCNRVFFSASLLKNHTVTHTGAREFKCELCPKTYTKKYGLREHMRSHTGDRRFKCTHCDMTFLQKCSLKGHLRSRHDALLS